MAKKIRGKLSAIYGGRASAGRDTLPLSILNGMTPRQHCEKLIAERGGKGHFKTVSESEDACMLYSCNFYGNCFEGAEYSYYYETYEKIELTSETVFVLPANRNRTKIGVGESVVIKSNVPVEWEISKKLVSIDIQDDRKLQISALDKAGSVTIIAKTNNDKAAVTFSIIEPKGVSYSQQVYMNSSEPMIYHPKNSCVAVVGLRVTLLPTTVNFGNLLFQEVDVASIDSGIFNDGKLHCHNGAPINGKCGTHTISPINTFNELHNLIGTYDVVGGGEDDPSKIKNLPASSAMHLDIPVRWKLSSSNAWKTMSTKVKQSILLLKNGTMTIRKGNFSKVFKRGDSFEKNDFLHG